MAILKTVKNSGGLISEITEVCLVDREEAGIILGNLVKKIGEWLQGV